MSLQLDYYFWLNSDWALLGAERLRQIGIENKVQINYIPVDLLQVYQRTGGIPLGQRSVERQSYREQELQRWSQTLNMPITISPRYMCPDATLASHIWLAATQLGVDQHDLHQDILRAQWCDEQDISNPSVLHLILSRHQVALDQVLDLANSTSIQTSYQRNTDQAVAAGVFGSPTYVFKQERFWGQDRLFMLEQALQQAIAI